MGKFLKIDERLELEEIVKKTRVVDERNRLCALLSYDDGRTPTQIGSILRLKAATISDYIKAYEESKKINNDPRGGSSSKLSDAQAAEVQGHLKETTYLHVKDIKAYIEQIYGVIYTNSGLTKWLKKQGFCYKRPATIPGKISPEQQEEFIKKYEELRDSLPKDESIFFVDSVHPAHQSQAVAGWILKGQQKHLQTTGKQKRLHYTGALCLGKENEDHQVIYRQSETVNQETTIDFLKLIEEQSNKKAIHLICDNAMYFKGKKVKEYVATSRIKIHHLPPYSPNLNPIERLWKLMREMVLYNKYYQDFNSFCSAVDQFFVHGIYVYKDKINSRINDNFQRFKPDFVNLAFPGH